MRTTLPAFAVRQNERIDRLELGLEELKAGTALINMPPPAVPLAVFLDWSGLTRRQYYTLAERGAVRWIIVGERSVWPIPQSYIDYLMRLDAEQNGPGAPPRVPVHPPPGRWGRAPRIGRVEQVLPATVAPRDDSI
jgi:hypothetical protein